MSSSKLIFVAIITMMALLSTSVHGFDLHPRNIHLALAGLQSQFMRVQWTTTDGLIDRYTPTIQYGASENNLLWTVSGMDKCTTTTYTNEEYHHACLLENTRASSRYFYRIGTGTTEAPSSPVYSFLMPPGLGSVHKSILLGDLGLIGGENTAQMLQLLNNDQATTNTIPRIAHINHCGDIAYSDDAHRGQPNPDFEPINNDFAMSIEPITRHVPYMVAVGNHDISASLATKDEELPEWGRNCTHYNHRWVMPSDTSRGVQSMWYSYGIGNTRFVIINTETDYPDAPYQPDKGDTRAGPFGDQTKWLEEELSRANRPEARLFQPWVIVIGHRPIYSTLINDFPADQQPKTRAWLEPLLQKYKVDLYVSGHSHLYERTYPLKDGKMTQQNYTQPQGPVYIVNGAAGNLEGHPVPGKDIMTDLPDFIPYRNGLKYNIGLLETFSTMPPKTLSSHRDENVGDYLDMDRVNITGTIQEEQSFWKKYDEQLAQSPAKMGKDDDKPTCPKGKKPISMCYSAYPVIVDPEIWSKQLYMDRFCIVKCA